MTSANQLSRRSLLKGAVAGSASLLTFNQLFNYSQLSAQDNANDPQTIVNLAATAELIACTHYYRVLTDSNIALAPDEIEVLKGFLDAELQHLELLYLNEAAPVTERFYLPVDVYNDREQFSLITEQLETTFIAAYLAATRQFAQLGFPLLAATSAQVSAVEQEHLALVRGIGGRRPNNVALARALFFNITEAVPALQPFLERSAGYEGPVSFPGADAIRELIGDVGVLPISPFSDPSIANVPGSNSVAGATCTVTPNGNFNGNLRFGPGLNFEIVGKLLAGDTVTVDAQSLDNDGFVWWRVSTGDRWVRSDVVRATGGDCSVLPALKT
ncbi:MAG: SH3 domain-containing protein [Chloroflexi bacterium]|nr:SH3 domain-containing protein [Chloroflexota bacterium]MCC6891661.1 ferritin-like domain-containing protein [Anaerolineae bacterium]